MDLTLKEPAHLDLEFFADAAQKAYGTDYGNAFRSDSLYNLKSWGNNGFWLYRANRGTYSLHHDMETESADQCYGPWLSSNKSLNLHTKDGKLVRISSQEPFGKSLDQLDPTSKFENYISMDPNELLDLADFLAPGAHANPMLRAQYDALVSAINLPPLQDMESIKSRIAAERKVTANDFPQLKAVLPSAEEKAQLQLALSGLNKIIAATTNGAYGAARMGADQSQVFDQGMDWDTRQSSPEGQRINAYEDKAALQGLAADMALRTGGTNLLCALPQIVSFTTQIPKCLFPYFELNVDPKIGHAFGGAMMNGRIEGRASRARMEFIETIKPAWLARTIAEVPTSTIGEDERTALLSVLQKTYGYKEGLQKLSTPEDREIEQRAKDYEANRAAALLRQQAAAKQH